MHPSPSPPQEPEHFRHQQLTPESPRPQTVPSPSNIPILELQMDPNFHESPHNNGTATPAPQFASQSQTPNPLASTPYFSDPSPAAMHQQVGGAQGAGGAAGYQSAMYGDGGARSQAQDAASIQNFSAQHQQSRNASAHDAMQTPGQEAHSAYSFALDNAYAAQQASAQAAPGGHYEGNAPTSVDVQALLDSLTPSAHTAQSGQYALPQRSPESAQAQPHASAAAHSAVPSLPARPPAQEHPNYTPSDDIRSFHPHSQQSPTTQQRAGNGQAQQLNVPAQSYAGVQQGGAQSPTTAGNAQKRQAGQRSETPGDDEDIRWPPEVNKRYEDFLDQFPMGSRLFIGRATPQLHVAHLTAAGNLPTEKVTKRDIFHRFYRHGRLAQISIKQAYGFVQFLDSESCRRALDTEQGQAVRGRKMRKWDQLQAGPSANFSWRPRSIKAPEEFAQSRTPTYARTTATIPLA
jgi:hypothetical protein